LTFSHNRRSCTSTRIWFWSRSAIRVTFASILAWNRLRNADLNGPQLGDENAFIARYVDRQRHRLRWIASLLEQDSPFVLRYEELVTDLNSIAGRFSQLLGVDLSANDVECDRRTRRRRATSKNPRASIGRWQDVLDDWMSSHITQALRFELAATGLPA
jgi:hypothetical protein